MNVSWNIQTFKFSAIIPKLSLILNLNMKYVVLIQTSVLMCSHIPYMNSASMLWDYVINYLLKSISNAKLAYFQTMLFNHPHLHLFICIYFFFLKNY